MDPEIKDSYLWRKHFPDKLYYILAYLSKKGKEAELSKIKEDFKDQMSNPVINDILFDLEVKKFVEAEKMNDKRKKKVKLTNNGRTLLQKLEELSDVLLLKSI
ncbi:MAG: hypothetical protein ACFFD2_15970 [Promethearchaeota archaeon]